ncbi:SDR family NAD(P)-dependent oxidoreductase [Patulibacter defluvii]|uniref:SDR family NAD(P)-dependent oxidoreductase n=1 Tax=Patulibacter defluvii TaxID=3095358 RepID=UPI002A75ACDF|nr:SDR family oxidoreductase [Patulibacter sp. DM4]
MSGLLEPGFRAAVVGAAGALGAATAQAFAAAGATVLAYDLDGAAAAGLVAELPGEGHLAAALDAGDREAVARAATAAGPVDAVVYAAGLAPTFEILDFDWAGYERTMAVNLTGALHVAQAFARAMVEAARPGSFVFLSSTAGKRGEAGAAAYCASKFALQGVVESFAAEVGRHGIRVNAICPGNVDTPMLQRVAAAQAARDGADAAAVLAGYAGETALGRLVAAPEVGRTAVWLASPLASGVTGESVNVDAGALTG